MFDRRLEAEICSRMHTKQPLSCILMDLDHFKEINDTYGHPVGDEVLQTIGGVITELCRTEDVACRIGGEEFVIIAPHTNGIDAEIFADRIRQEIADTRFKPSASTMTLLTGDSLRVTASFGVADSTDLYDRSMMQRADEALYRSKQEGRNCVSMAAPWTPGQQAVA